jgi:hypothetical protein
MRDRRYSASSLTDSLRSVVRLRRAVRAYRRGGNFLVDARKELSRNDKAALPFFHRLRPLTSITKSDAHISGGETRQDYKDTRRFPWWLPLALSCSRHAASVLWWKLYLNHHVPFRLDSSLQAGLCARTPVQPDRCALSGNYRLESNPERHDKTPLAAATGNRSTREDR